MNVTLVNLIGKLAFRTSYGQNMLEHSIECAYIASKIANDLGLNPTLAARCCLLHDIGKVDSVETGKSHVELGVLYAKENKEDEIVVNAIEAHHGDVEPTSEYAVLTIIADSVSAGRAGSRKNAYENYVERVSSLENIATKYEGVQSAFALQGGREVRVIVHNDQISDELMPKLASDIKREIESTITFPGTINVNIIRESRFNVEASKENIMEYND